MKHIFIINPVAGKSNQTKPIAAKINELFLNNEIEGTYRIETTSGIGDATRIARKYALSNEDIYLYACGGDGTLNEVLNGCFGYDNVHLTSIPIGTGNDFVKSFAYDAIKDFLDLNQMVHAKEKIIDVLEVDGRYAINIINAGFDAAIAKNMKKFKKLPLVNGSSAYNISLIYSFFTSLRNKMQFVIDDELQSDREYTFSVLANGQYYGGSYKAAPFSDMQDGLIDIILIPTLSRFKILKLINIYKRGEHLQTMYKDIIHFKRGRKVEILSKKPLTLCIDGEMSEYTNPTITIHSASLKFMLPSTYTNKS